MVIEARPGAGGYLLGFKIDDPQALSRVHGEVLALHEAWYEKPDFGIRYEVEKDAEGAGEEGGGAAGAGAGAGAAAPKARVQDDVTIIEDEESKEAEAGRGDVAAAYFADGTTGHAGRPVVFAPSLGLAVEAPPPGLSLERLWAV
jgi:hypothetical protein